MAYLQYILLSTLVGFFIALALLLVLLPSTYKKSGAKTSVQILVLGDIGRSPRMQYHALSVAKHGGAVHLIGYHESAPHPKIMDNPLIVIHPLAPPPAVLTKSSIPFIIAGPLKVLWQVATLVRVLAYTTPACTWLLVQNPPSIPTLFVAGFIGALRKERLMIDWHNYGWTILAGTKGPNHLFVKISKVYEIIMAGIAPYANITVSRAMRAELLTPPYNLETVVVTLHDRPADIFQPLKSEDERRAFLSRLPETKHDVDSIMRGSTKLIVSSTSWTPDEDFSLLLDALVTYAGGENHPPIIAIITGRGPQKSHYEDRIKYLESEGLLEGIRIHTAWLSMEDYARLLRCADLGVCLHMSSSGVDLPMKIVDMFGSALPVAAYSNYKSFGELVTEGVNGRGFEKPAQLYKILFQLFVDKRLGGGQGNELRRLRRGALEQSKIRWDDEWDRVLGRIFGFIEDDGIGMKPMC